MSKILRSFAASTAVSVVAATPASVEQESRLAGRAGEPALLLRHQPGPGPSVLYVHGSTFPSALSVAYRIDGRSWMDDLRSRGFDVWAFDFAGYGGSDWPAGMLAPVQDGVLPGRVTAAAGQIEHVVRHVLTASRHSRLALIAHSWGTMPAGLLAGRRPELIEHLVLFGPVARRGGEPQDPPAEGSVLVTAEDQWLSFAAGLPAGRPPLFAPPRFDVWAHAYLATDMDSGRRSPPAVRVPSGWQADLAEAWSGRFPYDPATVRAHTLIVRGEWDSVTRDDDAAWLARALTGVPGGARDLKLPRGGHRMHLEENRQTLFAAVGDFLATPSR
jgi:pimeloyl-ACP methyl ester carboxylesterase